MFSSRCHVAYGRPFVNAFGPLERTPPGEFHTQKHLISPPVVNSYRFDHHFACLVNATHMGVEMNITGHRDNNSQGSSRCTSDDHGSVGSDSSQIMSMSEQIVKYNANSTNDVARETNLVFRLERELTEAQQCNHRLNQQLKTLANSSNSTIKKELADAKGDMLSESPMGTT
ncbi:unnamed protein product [Caenorhabditis auriculariae]|uniref:Uncharacterized protein n=1 Tax=Caenorhabditis auriculariae TaxID=2777116 RepID=A0A8S1HEN4_9PELO|nr:unnamed protein product [Caenorhabditis auriculariae]